MRHTARVGATAAVAFLLGVTCARAQVSRADYDRAFGLRERWMYLTTDLADPVTWVDNTSRFYYRKTVKGGFEFVMVDARTLERQPAFDHAKLAAGLSTAAGDTFSALRLPFDSFRFSNGERAIEVNFRESGWTCLLSDYTCARRPEGGGRGAQPRSFGTTRDTAVPPDNRPKRSPNGQWEAFVSNYNVAVRPVGGTTVTALSNDGSEGEAYRSRINRLVA